MGEESSSRHQVRARDYWRIQENLLPRHCRSDWVRLIPFYNSFPITNHIDALCSQRSVQLTSLNLYVQAAIEADQCKLSEFAYDFMTQAYTVYEDDIAESREQFDSIRLIIGALQAMKNFDDESYDTLITKTAQHSSRLLKKPDQCIAVAMCSHLFFSSDSEVRAVVRLCASDTNKLLRDRNHTKTANACWSA